MTRPGSRTNGGESEAGHTFNFSIPQKQFNFCFQPLATHMIRQLLSKILLLLFYSLTFIPLAAQHKAEILWDKYGVPHIFSNTTEDQYYAFGWAQMTNHANLILHVYGESRGRAAEYWGEKYVESDKQVLLFKIPETAKKIHAAQSPGY